MLWLATLYLDLLLLRCLVEVLPIAAALHLPIEGHEDAVTELKAVYFFWMMGFIGLYPSVLSL